MATFEERPYAGAGDPQNDDDEDDAALPPPSGPISGGGRATTPSQTRALSGGERASTPISLNGRTVTPIRALTPVRVVTPSRALRTRAPVAPAQPVRNFNAQRPSSRRKERRWENEHLIGVPDPRCTARRGTRAGGGGAAADDELDGLSDNEIEARLRPHAPHWRSSFEQLVGRDAVSAAALRDEVGPSRGCCTVCACACVPSRRVCARVRADSTLRPLSHTVPQLPP